jgi:hypothetical protein
MALTITANATGTIDPNERRAIEMLAEIENARRAALDPPGTPLLVDTAANRKTTYETILQARLAEIHASYISQAGESLPSVREIKSALAGASNATLAQIATLLGL